jgi:hypothetical protein
MSRNNDLVEVNLTFLHHTEASWAVEDTDGRKHYLPKSECSIDPTEPDEGDDVTVSLPEWLAERKGLI